VTSLGYHVLLSLTRGPLYGYAIAEAVVSESSGTLTPRAGSLYRVIARLISDGFVKAAKAPAPVGPHPGKDRKYYALTATGRHALLAETARMKESLALAEKRLGVTAGRSS
jgi:DNA-binding PadR family transcriptional regulator